MPQHIPPGHFNIILYHLAFYFLLVMGLYSVLKFFIGFEVAALAA